MSHMAGFTCTTVFTTLRKSHFSPHLTEGETGLEREVKEGVAKEFHLAVQLQNLNYASPPRPEVPVSSPASNTNPAGALTQTMWCTL